MYIYIYNRKWAFKIFNQAVRNLKLTVASSSLYMYIRYAVFHRWRNICDTFEARPRLVVNARRWRQLPWRVLSGALVEQIDSQTPWHLAPQPRDPLEKEKVWIPGGERRRCIVYARPYSTHVRAHATRKLRRQSLRGRWREGRKRSEGCKGGGRATSLWRRCRRCAPIIWATTLPSLHLR